MNRIEDYYNCVRNSRLEWYLYRPEYLHLVAVVETAALIISGIGLPLIPLSILPLACNLATNPSARRIYSYWRLGFVIATMVYFGYRISYLNYVTTVSQSVRESNGEILTFFRPLALSIKDILFYALLLSYGLWILLLTMILPLQEKTTSTVSVEEKEQEQKN
ncbi:hypothetical protein WA171_002421 [Blastocystis sp. BT1]